MTDLPNADSFATARVALRGIDVIKELSEPRSIAKLVTLTGMDKSRICYHLDQFERHNLLRQDYEILQAPVEGSKGQARRVYYQNEEEVAAVQKTLEDISKYLRKAMESSRV